MILLNLISYNKGLLGAIILCIVDRLYLLSVKVLVIDLRKSASSARIFLLADYADLCRKILAVKLRGSRL